mmetsp:Transcript_18965/g.42383  ORF Transcript_18965/g.42383 Transcript_18965/m.42383 type:complete len:111 (+) Transcript_18965:1012-1344(+)
MEEQRRPRQSFENGLCGSHHQALVPAVNAIAEPCGRDARNHSCSAGLGHLRSPARALQVVPLSTDGLQVLTAHLEAPPHSQLALALAAWRRWVAPPTSTSDEAEHSLGCP